MKKAFTMAEILLSLTIIGVVAAITLPSLTGNINERTWNTQRKALYARFSQAIALMPALNGYGTLTEDASGSVTADTAAETFVTDGLAKVLKINNICDSEHLADCGINNKITTLNNSVFSRPTNLQELNPLWTSGHYSNEESYSIINVKTVAFETANGESILTFYNPNCIVETGELRADYYQFAAFNVCANFVYDLNGSKGPNAVGKDIGFITAIYPVDSVVVAPIPANQDLRNSTQQNASRACTASNAEQRLPNLEELIALFINKKLCDISTTAGIWSSSLTSQTQAWAFGMETGRKIIYPRTQVIDIRCIKRY